MYNKKKLKGSLFLENDRVIFFALHFPHHFINIYAML